MGQQFRLSVWGWDMCHVLGAWRGAGSTEGRGVVRKATESV